MVFREVASICPCILTKTKTLGTGVEKGVLKLTVILYCNHCHLLLIACVYVVATKGLLMINVSFKIKILFLRYSLIGNNVSSRSLL